MENLFLKKLQVKPGNKVSVINAPENANLLFGEIPDGIRIEYGGELIFDVLIVFSTSRSQLNHQIEASLKSISTKTIFWVFYPKKSSKVKSDLDLMNSWKELSVYNLSPCASAAVNETWTGLRLKFESAIKPSGMRNDHIKTNQYGDYINPETKTVKLPEDLAAVLNEKPNALDYYNSLAYSHRKEYVLWILSAKQEKTRQARIEKMIEMLMEKRKNPADRS